MSGTKRARPCGNCRRRKRRCITEPGNSVCVLCQFYSIDGCSFDGQVSAEQPAAGKLAKPGVDTTVTTTSPSSSVTVRLAYDRFHLISHRRSILYPGTYSIGILVPPMPRLTTHLFEMSVSLKTMIPCKVHHY